MQLALVTGVDLVPVPPLVETSRDLDVGLGVLSGVPVLDILIVLTLSLLTVSLHATLFPDLIPIPLPLRLRCLKSGRRVLKMRLKKSPLDGKIIIQMSPSMIWRLVIVPFVRPAEMLWKRTTRRKRRRRRLRCSVSTES